MPNETPQLYSALTPGAQALLSEMPSLVVGIAFHRGLTKALVPFMRGDDPPSPLEIELLQATLFRAAAVADEDKP